MLADPGSGKHDQASDQLSMQVDLKTYRDCQIPDKQLFLLMCGVDPSTATLPLPVLEVSTIPRISRVMNAAYQTYADLMV